MPYVLILLKTVGRFKRSNRLCCKVAKKLNTYYTYYIIVFNSFSGKPKYKKGRVGGGICVKNDAQKGDNYCEWGGAG